jgi:NADPH-dependent curcumin reductase CurA
LFNPGARMTICGVIAQFADGAEADGKAYIMNRGESVFRERGVTVRDLFVGDFVADHQDAFLRDMAGWVAAGQVKYREDIRQGFETIPEVFGEMMRGGNFGKTLVQIGDDPTL